MSAATDLLRLGRALAEKKNADSWAGTDDRIHVSEIGKCPRQTVFDHLKVVQTHPEDFPAGLVMDVGTAYHQILQGYLKETGFLIRADFKDDPFVVGDQDVVGHPDALLTCAGVLECWDFKSIKDGGFGKPWMWKKEHVMQLNTYMGLMGVKHGRVVYVNRNNGELLDSTHAFDSDMYSRTRNEVVPALRQTIDRARQYGELPVIPADYGEAAYPCFYKTKDGQQSWCRYHGHCWGKRLNSLSKQQRLGVSERATPKTVEAQPQVRSEDSSPVVGPGVLAP